MSTEHLVQMANQIARFFAAYPEQEAVAGVENHISKFWAPDMRDQLLQHIAGGGEGLSPLVTRAMAGSENG